MPPPTNTAVPTPTGWPNIRTTYDQSIGAKIDKATKDKLPKTDILAGIDYWLARLNEDKTAVALLSS